MSITRGGIKSIIASGADAPHGASISDSDALTDQQIKEIFEAIVESFKTVDPDKGRPKIIKY